MQRLLQVPNINLFIPKMMIIFAFKLSPLSGTMRNYP